MNVMTELMTIRDVAAALRLSPRTVWRMVSTGSIPQPIRLGRSVRWQRSEIENWLTAEQEDANAHGRH
ncbi:MAG: helix-turn-helix domain-containing protein [Lentisphaerae bacterium]|nr:helix-turn-helix domain-containing protein [Lentisphaerota bacterium]